MTHAPWGSVLLRLLGAVGLEKEVMQFADQARFVSISKIQLLDVPGDPYWQTVDDFVREQLGKTDRNGKLASYAAPIANWASDLSNNTTRPLLEKFAGVENARLYVKRRF